MRLETILKTPAEELAGMLRITVLESRSVLLGSHWDFDLCSPFWRLYVNRRSGAWVDHDGRRFDLGKGEVWLIPAWVRFQTGVQTNVSGEVRQDYLHFEVRGLPSTFLQRLFATPLRLPSSPALRELHRQWQGEDGFRQFCWASALAHGAFAGAWAMAQNDAATLKGRRERLMGEPGEPLLLEQEERLRKALNALEMALSEPPTNRQLATLFGCSEDHFIRLFRRAMGMTPSAYGRMCRLAAGAESLIATEGTLDEIAAACGFSDRFHFSKAFKARFGQSPAAYRRAHRREIATLFRTAPQ